LGSAVLLGDVQVMLEGKTYDCLQKVHALAPNLVAGFAGNVYAGFQLLAALHYLIEDEKRRSHAPLEIDRILARYPEWAKGMHDELEPRYRGTSAVMVAGASRMENRLYESAPMVGRFRGPAFQREDIPVGRWEAIGSGSDVAAYRDELQTLSDPGAELPLAMESNRPGGMAHTMAIATLSKIRDLPSQEGISRDLFSIYLVFAQGFSSGTSETTMFGPNGEVIEIRMPDRIARNFTEFIRIMGDLNASSDAAAAVA
jgi:hypothetical protein